MSRENLLRQCFNKVPNVDIDKIIELGPVEAGCSREVLQKVSSKLIFQRTTASSIASFVVGIPGGLAMAATIPADLLQFFGIALRLAQEITYIYGAPDLWNDGTIDNDKVQGQLILYCGAMFGISGAVAGVRFLSSQVAKQVLKKLPQKALTKTVWYPIVKKIGTAIGVKVTKNTVAKGISKAVPVLGGFVSGGLNFASMLPMGNRLAKTMDEAKFEYNETEAIRDFETINAVAFDVSDSDADDFDKNCDYENKEEVTDNNENSKSKKLFHKVSTDIGNGISQIMNKKSDKDRENTKGILEKDNSDKNKTNDDVFATIEKLAKLKEVGAITQEEFESKKAELLKRI